MIRPAQTEEFPALAELWLRASARAHSFIPLSFWQGQKGEMCHSYLPQSKTLVLEKEGKAVGFLSLRGCHIEALFIDPESQGKGYGSALLQWAQGTYDRLSLCAYQKNERAVRFYQRHGFTMFRRGKDKLTGEPDATLTWQSGRLGSER